LRMPDRRFEYVTCLPLLFSSFLIFSLTLPIVARGGAREITNLLVEDEDDQSITSRRPPKFHQFLRRRRRLPSSPTIELFLNE
jgi:hypothetical protein